MDREPGSGPDSRLTTHDSRMEGVVLAQLPSGLYQVDVDGRRITAHIGGGERRNFVRVIVELTPRDLTRGRIVQKA